MFNSNCWFLLHLTKNTESFYNNIKRHPIFKKGAFIPVSFTEKRGLLDFFTNVPVFKEFRAAGRRLETQASMKTLV